VASTDVLFAIFCFKTWCDFKSFDLFLNEILDKKKDFNKSNK